MNAANERKHGREIRVSSKQVTRLWVTRLRRVDG
jgi:hypothetical protein